MPKYRASAVVSGSKYLGVFEAKDAEEAKDKAWDSDEATVSMCYHCDSECEDPQIIEVIVEECDE